MTEVSFLKYDWVRIQKIKKWDKFKQISKRNAENLKLCFLRSNYTNCHNFFKILLGSINLVSLDKWLKSETNSFYFFWNSSFFDYRNLNLTYHMWKQFRKSFFNSKYSLKFKAIFIKKWLKNRIFLIPNFLPTTLHGNCLKKWFPFKISNSSSGFNHFILSVKS